MPTTRARHPVTETDDVAAILDQAARRWPTATRAELIRLVLADWSTGGQAPERVVEARNALAGSLPGSGGLYDRAVDWPL